MATNLRREQLLKRCRASPCRQCHTDTSVCFSLTYVQNFFCGFFFSKSSYIILTALTISDILAPFSIKSRAAGLSLDRCMFVPSVLFYLRNASFLQDRMAIFGLGSAGL